jgi:hypothetical protein
MNPITAPAPEMRRFAILPDQGPLPNIIWTWPNLEQVGDAAARDCRRYRREREAPVGR